MGLTLEVLAATACVLGMTALVWRLMARWSHPISGMPAFVVLPARGDGEQLESAVRDMVRLRTSGLLRGSILIVDIDLTAQGDALARELTQRWPDVILSPAGDFGRYIIHEG